MRGAAVGSAVAHAGLTVALFVVHPARGMLVPGPDVVQVSLLDPSASTPAPAAPAAPDVPAQREEQGVRIEPAPRARPREQARPEPPAPVAPAPAAPATPSPRVVLPYAAVGGGLSGQVAVDESNFEFAYYLQQVRVLIARNWTPPPGAAPGTRAEIWFRVSRDGTLTETRIDRSSGNAFYDQAAARAVIITGHLPPLPLGYAGADLGIHFGFEYTGQ